MMTDTTAKRDSRVVRIVAFVEGTTLLALVFVGMPLKHAFGLGIFNAWLGPMHGVAFLVYAAVVIVAFLTTRRSFDWLVMAMLAGIIPGGTFWFFTRPSVAETRQRQSA